MILLVIGLVGPLLEKEIVPYQMFGLLKGPFLCKDMMILLHQNVHRVLLIKKMPCDFYYASYAVMHV
jgi:hypothetical protein